MTKMKYKDFMIETEGFAMANNLRYGNIATVSVRKDKEIAVFAFAVAGLEVASARIKKRELIKMAIDKVKRIIDLGCWTPWKEYAFEQHGRQFLEVKNPKWWVSAKPKKD